MRKKASSWKVLGGVRPIAVRSLGAGSDKGETGRHLPLRLIGGFGFVVRLLSCLEMPWGDPAAFERWVTLGRQQ